MWRQAVRTDAHIFCYSRLATCVSLPSGAWMGQWSKYPNSSQGARIHYHVWMSLPSYGGRVWSSWAQVQHQQFTQTVQPELRGFIFPLCRDAHVSQSRLIASPLCLRKDKKNKINNSAKPSSVEPHCSIGCIYLDNFYPLFFSPGVKLFDPNNCRRAWHRNNYFLKLLRHHDYEAYPPLWENSFCWEQIFEASASSLPEEGLAWSQDRGEVVTAQSSAGPLPFSALETDITWWIWVRKFYW